MASQDKPSSGRARLEGVAVLQVIPALEAGGAERTTLEVARGIVAAGGRSLVVSEGGRLTDRLVAEGSRHIEMPAASKNPMVMAATRAALASLIKEEGVDLVHARSRAPAWPAMAAARATGASFVTTYHGIYSGSTRLKQAYNSVMARGDVVIANSSGTESAIRSTYARWRFFDPARLVTIPRGADLEAFDPAAVSPGRVKAVFDRLGGEDAVRILLPGRLTEWKGQRVLIDAARRLRGRAGLPSLRVALIGDAQGREAYEEALTSMIEEADLSRIVRLGGHWDDMPAAYAWSDIVVSASTRPEAFGRVAVEAMAMGKPVVATAHGGSLETVVDGETGRHVPPGDDEALADAIAELAADPAKRAAMGEAGRARAAERFSVDAMVSATLSVYASLTNARGTAR